MSEHGPGRGELDDVGDAVVESRARHLDRSG